MVKDYMARPNTIILAVVSAIADPDNKQVLQLAREHDPGGERTMGIITIPDASEKSSKLFPSY